MTLFHGTQHPYKAGDALVSGGIVKGCDLNGGGDPTPGCDCGCDGRLMVWATPVIANAVKASVRRCGCDDYKDAEHYPRIFEVTLTDPEPDPNKWAAPSVMAASGRIVREVTIASIKPT